MKSVLEQYPEKLVEDTSEAEIFDQDTILIAKDGLKRPSLISQETKKRFRSLTHVM